MSVIVAPLLIETMEQINLTGIDDTHHAPSHLLAFASGRGGVGKSSVIVNMASAMVRRGGRVCIFDADNRVSGISNLLGLRPSHTLDHVLIGEKTVNEVLITTCEGFAVLPGASAITELTLGDAARVQRLSYALSRLEEDYDFFLIDTASGMADSIIALIDAAPTTFLVVTPEPTALNDAFSLLKRLNAKAYQGRLRVLVNQAVDYPIATETYRRFATAVEKHLDLTVEYGGFVARDDNVPRAVALQVPVVDLAADSPASRCLFALADNVLKYIGQGNASIGLRDYCRKLQIDRPADALHIDNAITDQRAVAKVSDTSGFDKLASQLLSAINNPDIERPRLDRAVSEWMDAYLTRFDRFPSPVRQWFFRWLETEDYSASRLLELTATLEALHMSRHQKPLFTLEDSVARLIAQCQGSQHRFKALIAHLRTAFRQSFKSDPVDIRREVVAAIKNDDFTEERFEALMSDLRDAYQQRFGRPYQGHSELLVESTADALAKMETEERRIKQQLDGLVEHFHHLAARRDALLSALASPHNDDIHLTSSPTDGV